MVFIFYSFIGEIISTFANTSNLLQLLLAPKHRRIPMTYDNHPTQSHPIPQSLFNHLNGPWIDLSGPQMN